MDPELTSRDLDGGFSGTFSEIEAQVNEIWGTQHR